jgi:hypothetical protein
MSHLNATLVAVLLGIGLFGSMLLFLELGRRRGVRQTAKYGDTARTGVGKADAPVYGLLALLIGFSFSGAAARYDHRRELVSQQVNTALTAWQRVDALPPEMQPPIRAGFQSYLDALISMYSRPPQRSDALRDPPDVSRARANLWSGSMAACLTQGGDKARMLLLPSLNEMFDVAETERLARRIHTPLLIFVMLGVSALASALFAGYALANGPRRNWMYMIGIAATVGVAMYVIVELEYPRLGLLRIETMDQALVELRASLK